MTSINEYLTERSRIHAAAVDNARKLALGRYPKDETNERRRPLVRHYMMGFRYGNSPRLVAALQVVLDAHTRAASDDGSGVLICGEDDYEWPCPTIYGIATILGVEP